MSNNRDVHEYTDWQTHFETCPRCRRDHTCDVGAELKRQDEKRRAR